MKQTFVLQPEPNQSRVRVMRAIRTAPDGYVVQISEPTRNLDQNAAQWPILQAYEKQKQLCVNDVMEWVSDEEWKDVLTGAYKEEISRVANYRGRMVILGKRTSKFKKDEFSEWLDWLNAAAVEDGIELERETA